MRERKNIKMPKVGVLHDKKHPKTANRDTSMILGGNIVYDYRLNYRRGGTLDFFFIGGLGGQTGHELKIQL